MLAFRNRLTVARCESMHEHAMVVSQYTEIVLLYALLQRTVGNTALNAEMNDECE